jgi:hypothetical protein
MMLHFIDRQTPQENNNDKALLVWSPSDRLTEQESKL